MPSCAPSVMLSVTAERPMSGVRKPFAVQHRSHVRRESTQGSRGADSVRDGGITPRNCAELPKAPPAARQSNRLVRVVDPLVEPSCAKSSMSTWTRSMPRLNNAMIRNRMESPSSLRGKAPPASQFIQALFTSDR